MPMDAIKTGIYPVLSGNGTLRHSWKRVTNYTVCTSLFGNEDAKVVCLNWGYLPDKLIRYTVPLERNLSYSAKWYQCIGNETVLDECKSGTLNSACANQQEKQLGISCERGDTLAGFSVYVSDTPHWKSGTLCYQHDINEPVNNNVSIDCFTTGRYVTIHNSRNGSLHSTLSSFAYINICEVNVTGCDIGHYGDECLECPSHCTNNTCQIKVGHCFDCEDGYTGPMCEKVCPTGRYGVNCSFRCGNCLDEKSCHHINGTCISGCSPGWKGEWCDQNCDLGYFGFECNSNCKIPNCVNSTSCDPISGHCTSGCFSNFSGPFCQDCAQTYYGNQCNSSCSDHCQSKLCNQTTGYCFSCIDTRSGVFCENEIPISQQAVAAEDIPFTVIGAIIAVFVLVLLVLFLVCLMVRRKRRLDTKNEDAIGLAPTETPMSERKTNLYLEQTPDAENEETTSAAVYNLSYVTNSANPRYSDQEDTESEAESANGSSLENLTSVVLLSENLGDIPIPELHDYILRKHRNTEEGFRAEFKALPEGDISRCTIGGQEKNTLRNRFRNTLPYDHSRVVLTDPGGEDYINANYISNVQGDIKYIACQGPKPTTVKDFWRMIWQEKIHTVVMLTRTIEGDKRKCEQYWPSLGRTIISGKVDITTVDETNYAFFTIRKLKVTNSQESIAEIRHLHHFHFNGWPDHGVPPTSQLLSFYFQVREQLNVEGRTSPIVVHCSAGVGRTGTFIAIDALAQNGVNTGNVNVTKYVSKLRRERMHMIQTVGQYITVYKCLDEYFNFPRHVISKETLPKHSVSHGVLQEEYQEMNRFLRNVKEYEACNTKQETNDDSNPLIIAEYPSFWIEDGFLVSRHPLSTELFQHLSILSDVVPSAVIVLDADQSTAEEWIPEGKDLVIGRYVVKKTKSRVVSVNRRMSTIGVTIKHGDDEEVEFRVIEPVASQDSDYSNITHLSDILDAFTSLTLQKDNPVFILNNENSVEVLTTVIVINALQQLWHDGETDICFLARYLQIIQDTEPLSLDDYVECYRLVSKFVNRYPVLNKEQTEENVYAN
uniref:protein-tyrosine-phosphatase n=1 Tax=Crassostrea virginica TaxID=6565 RepID=A0A8B8C1H0_CRAVI|nr:receptor-type tyrosine-protein phosphatase zeta-like [Crassostrea virginica]